YRQLKKLDSTYVDGLLKVVDEKSHKVHTRFNQALTQTGRLSSTEPNLQNIPIRLEEGRKIRHVFVPSHEDWLIFSADYSQIEVKIFLLKLRWTYVMYQRQKWMTICAVKLKQLILESFMVLVIMDYPKIYKYLEKKQKRSLISILRFILM